MCRNIPLTLRGGAHKQFSGFKMCHAPTGRCPRPVTPMHAPPKRSRRCELQQSNIIQPQYHPRAAQSRSRPSQSRCAAFRAPTVCTRPTLEACSDSHCLHLRCGRCGRGQSGVEGGCNGAGNASADMQAGWEWWVTWTCSAQMARAHTRARAKGGRLGCVEWMVQMGRPAPAVGSSISVARRILDRRARATARLTSAEQPQAALQVGHFAHGCMNLRTWT